MTASERIRRVVFGKELSSEQASAEQITPVEGLSALSLDALTSVAYGPEAILLVLAGAGAAALHLMLPITLAIIGLLVLLVISYRQVIDAYPHGGGAYAVSRDNFGARAGKLAGASLIVDYTLTVAVSIAAGVGQLTSAFPSTASYTVPMCLGILLVITVLNLRGLGEGARIFLLPTMVFIVGLLAIIAIGMIHPLGLATPQKGRSLVPAHTVEAVSVLLVLKAFSAGCSALTGVEAIANGVPLFREPRVVRAKRTELLLGSILGVMLLGLALLTDKFHVEPRTGQTVLSQIMVYAVGRHWAYYIVSLTITLVLALAANTSFGGLPVLTSLLARDNYLPHFFGLARQPAGLRQRCLGTGGVLGGPAGRGEREHQLAHPPVRHRGVHRLHHGPVGPGGPLAADPRTQLVAQSTDQRGRRDRDGGGDDHLPCHQIRGRCVGGRRGDPPADRAVQSHRVVLCTVRTGARDRRDPGTVGSEAHRRRRPRELCVPVDSTCSVRGGVAR